MPVGLAWTAPIGTEGANEPSLSYHNGYWMLLIGSGGTNTTRVKMWVTTNPKGNWTSVTQPMAIGATEANNTTTFVQTCNTVEYDGTYYFYGSYQRVGSTGSKQRLVSYATDPLGTWSIAEMGPYISGYLSNDVICGIRYTNGRWIIFGTTIFPPSDGWIAYSDTGLFGSYTRLSATSLGLTSGQVWYLEDVIYHDGYYYLAAYNTNAQHLKYCSASTLDSWTSITLPSGWYTSGSHWMNYYIDQTGSLWARQRNGAGTGFNNCTVARGVGSPVSSWDSQESATTVDYCHLGNGVYGWLHMYPGSNTISYVSLTLSGTKYLVTIPTGLYCLLATDGTDVVTAAMNTTAKYLGAGYGLVPATNLGSFAVNSNREVEFYYVALIKALRLNNRQDDAGIAKSPLLPMFQSGASKQAGNRIGQGNTYQ